MMSIIAKFPSRFSWSFSPCTPLPCHQAVLRRPKRRGGRRARGREGGRCARTQWDRPRKQQSASGEGGRERGREGNASKFGTRLLRAASPPVVETCNTIFRCSMGSHDSESEKRISLILYTPQMHQAKEQKSHACPVEWWRKAGTRVRARSPLHPRSGKPT